MSRGVAKETESMSWRTPPYLFRSIENHFGLKFVLDIAASPENAMCDRFLTEDDNTLNMGNGNLLELFMEAAKEGLEFPRSAVWCNPPYSNLERWVEIANLLAKMRVPVAMLIPSSRTEQPFWHQALKYGAHIGYIKGRVKFLRDDCSGSCRPIVW